MGGNIPTAHDKDIESTAQHLAMLVYPWDAASRSRIRRRVQDLLRCHDPDEASSWSRGTPNTEALWSREAIRAGIERAHVAPAVGGFFASQPYEQTHDSIVRRTKDAIRREFGIVPP